jgi:hypothetical protein
VYFDISVGEKFKRKCFSVKRNYMNLIIKITVFWDVMLYNLVHIKLHGFVHHDLKFQRVRTSHSFLLLPVS